MRGVQPFANPPAVINGSSPAAFYIRTVLSRRRARSQLSPFLLSLFEKYHGVFNPRLDRHKGRGSVVLKVCGGWCALSKVQCKLLPGTMLDFTFSLVTSPVPPKEITMTNKSLTTKASATPASERGKCTSEGRGVAGTACKEVCAHTAAASGESLS